MNRKRKILTLDGGGIKGVLAAAFLETVEEATGKRIADHFDLIAGTSTGGIIALGLGLGMSAREIVQFYVNCVFRRSWTAISRQAGHAFQSKLDSQSVATRGFRFLLC